MRHLLIWSVWLLACWCIAGCGGDNGSDSNGNDDDSDGTDDSDDDDSSSDTGSDGDTDGDGDTDSDTDSDSDSDTESDSTTDWSTEPEADPAFDASSGGVYKGVLAGSSGVFKVVLDNGIGEVFAHVRLDENEVTLPTVDLATWEPGQAISGADFTGTIGSDDVTLTFSVEADGSNPVVAVYIPDHEIVAHTSKETSDALVECYEGHAWQDGVDLVATWNFTVSGTVGSGVWADTGDPGWGTIEFDIAGSAVVNGAGFAEGELPALLFEGSISGYSASGDWENTLEQTTGTWAGERTL